MADAIETAIRTSMSELDSASTDSGDTVSAEESSSSESIESTEATGTESVTTSAESTTSQPSAEDAARAATVAEEAELDRLLGEVDSPQRRPGRPNSIPQPRVKQMVSRARDKAAAEHVAKLKEHADKIETYEQQLQQVAQFESLMFDNPERFLDILRSMPQYSERLTPRQQAQLQQQADPNADMPQPDGPDGSYTLQGLQKLLEWQSAQTEQRVMKRYAPMQEQWESQQQIAAAMPVIQNQLQDAASWELFAENQDEILKVLQDDSAQAERLGRRPQLSLEAAYRKVVFPKLRANRDTMRADLLKEINQQPRSTSAVVNTSAARQDEGGSSDITEIIRAAARKLK